MLADSAKAAGVIGLAAILQASVFSDVHVLKGTPDLLLDTADLGTLGVTSLLLTLAGYWIGRYGETTARDRSRSPFLTVAVVTLLYLLGALLLHFMLGEPAPARRVLFDTLFQGIALNLALTVPVYALCRRLLPQLDRTERVQGVHLLG